MDVYQTEEQQVEAIKKFFQKNGKTLLFTAIAVVAIIFGMQYLKKQKYQQSVNASLLFQNMLVAIDKNDVDTIELQSQELINRYPRTPYAALGSLLMGKIAIEENNLDQAAKHLQRLVEDKRADKTFRHLAVVRLARVLNAQQQQEAALKLLDTKPEAYQALYAEVRGDIFVGQGKVKEAIVAYQQAAEVSPESFVSPWLELKLNDLGAKRNKEENEQ